MPYLSERSVRNAGRVICFPSVPGRVAALSYGGAELLCALGLEDRLTAVSPAEDAFEHVLPQYREILASVPLLRHNGDGIPTAEELRALGVDLVLCSWFFPKMLSDGEGNDPGFQMYVTESTIPEKAGLEQLYRDILNLGRIFRVEDRAVALVEQTRMRIAALTRRVARRRPVRVFVYDGGEYEPLTALKGTLENDLIALSGGENVFGGLEGAYGPVGWRQVAEADPEVILLHDYQDSMDAGEKIAFLRGRQELAGVSAVEEGRFVVLTLTEVFPGVQTANAIEKMIRGFHPSAL